MASPCTNLELQLSVGQLNSSQFQPALRFSQSPIALSHRCDIQGLQIWISLYFFIFFLFLLIQLLGFCFSAIRNALAASRRTFVIFLLPFFVDLTPRVSSSCLSVFLKKKNQIKIVLSTKFRRRQLGRTGEGVSAWMNLLQHRQHELSCWLMHIYFPLFCIRNSLPLRILIG